MGVSSGLDGGLWIVQNWNEAFAFQMLGLGQAGKFGEGWIEIEQFSQGGGGLAGMVLLGRSNDHRHAGIPFEAGGLGPEPVFPEVKAVVGGKGDKSIFPKAKAVEFGKHAADLGIHITYGGIVTVA